MSKILIIDDDRSLCYSLQRVLGQLHEVHTSNNSVEAFGLLDKELFDLVLLDYRLGKENGLEVLQTIRKKLEDLPVVIMTAFGSNDVVMESINSGAKDYLVKPVDPEDIEETIRKYSRKNVTIPKEEVLPVTDYQIEPESIIGSSRAINETLKTVAMVANSATPVFLSGESGTGKDLVAKLIHKYSNRREKPFLAINCAAIPENLLESELFGYAKGAFTGAYQTKIGKFEFADGGIVFLDEIGDMPPSLQAKLLRFLQEGTVEKLGENRLKKVDVRIISATNSNISERIATGLFRKDLFFRLNVVNIKLPPLRERKNDIKELLIYFTKLYAEKLNKEITSIEKKSMDYLESYDWPGNIRELQNVIKRAVILASSDCLKREDFVIDCQNTLHHKFSESVFYEYFTSHFKERLLENSIEQVEKELIQKTLEKNKYNQSKSAEELGISRVTLNAKIKKYRIEKKQTQI